MAWTRPRSGATRSGLGGTGGADGPRGRAGELPQTLGRVRALLTALEDSGVVDVHAWPRPLEGDRESVRYAIGLGRTPPDATQLAEIADGWVKGLPGAEVAWAECGAVPTLR